MAAAPSESAAPAGQRTANKWLVAVAVMLATTMEWIDGTIANVALLHIRGSLSAGVDEAAWVLTSYIVANAIIIPLTGWCGAYFGRKRFFIFSILLFVFGSLMAGASPNLQTLVFCRVLQGLGGGAMMPMSQAIMMETFPPEEQAVAMSVWGLGAMIAPVGGPILGGWITDNYSWRWIFYINVPVGLIATLMMVVFVHDPAYLRRDIKTIDWWGLWLLVAGLACLQVMLDKGERLDWFDSHFIRTLTAVSCIGLLLFVIRELRTSEPIVDLRVLHNRTFALGTIFTTVVMFGMYGTYILIPLFCQQISGYTPTLAGLVLSIQSLGTLVSILFAGRLFNKIDPRLMVAAGCLAGGVGSWYMTHFYAQIDFWNIAMPGILRGIASGFIFLPLTTLSLGAVSMEDMGTASGLFNMVRTIGGSVGIAILVAMLTSGAQIHQNYLAGRVDPFRLSMLQQAYPAASGASANFTPHGSVATLGMMYIELQRQAAVMAFIDDFRIIAYIFFVLTPVALFMRKPAARSSALAGH
jgi:MFS transporter, DHA2 family, multidrug resistance protein